MEKDNSDPSISSSFPVRGTPNEADLNFFLESRRGRNGRKEESEDHRESTALQKSSAGVSEKLKMQVFHSPLSLLTHSFIEQLLHARPCSRLGGRTEKVPVTLELLS